MIDDTFSFVPRGQYKFGCNSIGGFIVTSLFTFLLISICMVAHSYHSKFAKDFAKTPSKINRYFNENVKQKISNT